MDGSRVNVLFVCTGNLCRSPIAEALMRQRSGRVGLDVDVKSSGLIRDDVAVPGEVAEAGALFGLDLSEHRSRTLAVVDIEWADIVLGMAREHVREVVVTRQPAWPRCFTLREIVRRARSVGPRRSDEDVEIWLARLHQGRRAADLMGLDVSDDIEDPLGGPIEGYHTMARELSLLVDELIAQVSTGGKGAQGAPGPEDQETPSMGPPRAPGAGPSELAPLRGQGLSAPRSSGPDLWERARQVPRPGHP